MTRGRVLRALLVGVALTALAATTFAGLLLGRPLPAIDGHYRLVGLRERAEVVRDIFGVPRIEAGNPHDLFFLQGYVTAQDRFAQMEAMRSRSGGRTGPIASLEPFVDIALEAYAAGVTKYIDQHTARRALPAEIALSGRSPRSWTREDSLAVLSSHLGASSSSVCVSIGSGRAYRGRPLLAAELAIDAPAPGWYEISLDGPGMRAIGLSLPGIPGIVAGHNGVLAWSFHATDQAVEAVGAAGMILRALSGRTADDLMGPAGGGAALGGCAAESQGRATGISPRLVFADADGAAFVGRDRAEALPRELFRARGLDVEAIRVLLGPPRAADAAARIVIDLGDLDASKAALSTGQSGHPAALHYRDQVPLWDAGQLHRLAWTRAAVTRTEGQLVLRAR